MWQGGGYKFSHDFLCLCLSFHNPVVPQQHPVLVATLPMGITLHTLGGEFKDTLGNLDYLVVKQEVLMF